MRRLFAEYKDRFEASPKRGDARGQIVAEMRRDFESMDGRILVVSGKNGDIRYNDKLWSALSPDDNSDLQRRMREFEPSRKR